MIENVDGKYCRQFIVYRMSTTIEQTKWQANHISTNGTVIGTSISSENTSKSVDVAVVYAQCIRIINRTSLVKRDHHTIKMILNSFLFNEATLDLDEIFGTCIAIIPHPTIQTDRRSIHGSVESIARQTSTAKTIHPNRSKRVVTISTEISTQFIYIASFVDTIHHRLV